MRPRAPVSATAKQALRNAEAVQAAAEDRHKHGIGTVIEVAQANQGAAQAKLAVVQATGGAQDAYLALIGRHGRFAAHENQDRRRLGPQALALDGEARATIIAESIAPAARRAGRLCRAEGEPRGVRAAQAEFLPKLFVSATGAYNNGDLSVSAIPSVGQEAADGQHQRQPCRRHGARRRSACRFTTAARAPRLLERAQAEADSADAG